MSTKDKNKELTDYTLLGDSEVIISDITLRSRTTKDEFFNEEILIISESKEAMILSFNDKRFVVESKRSDLIKTAFYIESKNQLLYVGLTFILLIQTLINLSPILNIELVFNYTFIFLGILVALICTVLALVQTKLVYSFIDIIFVEEKEGIEIWKAY